MARTLALAWWMSATEASGLYEPAGRDTGPATVGGYSVVCINLLSRLSATLSGAGQRTAAVSQWRAEIVMLCWNVGE